MGKASRKKKLAITTPESSVPLFLRNRNVDLRLSTGDKLSKILLEFAEGHLPHYEQEVLYRERLAWCIVAWNLSLFTEDRRAVMLIHAASAIRPEDRSEMMAEVSLLISRKEMLYPEDRRLIRDYELLFTATAVSLSVASHHVPDTA